MRQMMNCLAGLTLLLAACGQTYEKAPTTVVIIPQGSSQSALIAGVTITVTKTGSATGAIYARNDNDNHTGVVVVREETGQVLLDRQDVFSLGAHDSAQNLTIDLTPPVTLHIVITVYKSGSSLTCVVTDESCTLRSGEAYLDIR